MFEQPTKEPGWTSNVPHLSRVCLEVGQVALNQAGGVDVGTESEAGLSSIGGEGRVGSVGQQETCQLTVAILHRLMEWPHPLVPWCIDNGSMGTQHLQQ